MAVLFCADSLAFVPCVGANIQRREVNFSSINSGVKVLSPARCKFFVMFVTAHTHVKTLICFSHIFIPLASVSLSRSCKSTFSTFGVGSTQVCFAFDVHIVTTDVADNGLCMLLFLYKSAQWIVALCLASHLSSLILIFKMGFLGNLFFFNHCCQFLK